MKLNRELVDEAAASKIIVPNGVNDSFFVKREPWHVVTARISVRSDAVSGLLTFLNDGRRAINVMAEDESHIVITASKGFVWDRLAARSEVSAINVMEVQLRPKPRYGRRRASLGAHTI